MGLFGHTKKEAKDELPPLQFPELPKTVPAYKPEEKPMPAQPAALKDIPIKPVVHRELPASMGSNEQPLFIKIEKYRDVVDTLGKLRTRLSEAEHILNKLNRLKDEEDRELAAWHNDLTKIRNQLMHIDKQIFD